MKKILIACLISMLSFGMNCSPISIQAATESNESEMSVQFDLTNSGKQEIHITDKEGNPVIVSLENVTPQVTYSSSDLNYGNSSWKISWNSIGSNCGFYIDVNVGSNGLATITDIYDGYYTIYLFNVTKAELQITRAKETSSRPAQAQYYFEGTPIVIGGGSNGWLRAEIKNMVLTSSYN